MRRTRMIRYIAVITAAFLMAIPFGCQDPSEINWDWWKQSSATARTEGKEDTGAKLVTAEEIEKASEDKTGEETGDKAPDPLPPPPTSREELEMERHRQEVWNRVTVLRDRAELSPDQQKKVIAQARRDMSGWYRPLKIDPPDPDSKDWIHVLVWDFMPEKEFEASARRWVKTAKESGVQVPEPLTRRAMPRLINDCLKALEQNEG
jgi:hypothetical protein